MHCQLFSAGVPIAKSAFRQSVRVSGEGFSNAASNRSLQVDPARFLRETSYAIS